MVETQSEPRTDRGVKILRGTISMNRLEQKIERLVKEFRQLNAITGKTSLEFVLRTVGNDEVEKVKNRLVHALFELQNDFCEENGWATTNPIGYEPFRKTKATEKGEKPTRFS